MILAAGVEQEVRLYPMDRLQRKIDAPDGFDATPDFLDPPQYTVVQHAGTVSAVAFREQPFKLANQHDGHLMASAALKELVVRLSLVCPAPVLSVSPLRTFSQPLEAPVSISQP